MFIMLENGKLSLVENGETFSLGSDFKLKEGTEVEVKSANAYEQMIQEQLIDASKILEKQNSLEIVPNGNYVLVKPYEKNPYQQIEVLDGGLVLPEREIYYKNPNSGEVELEENLSVVGHVLEIGPMVKHIKPGDDVFYRRVQGVPVPFFRQGLEVVSEISVQAIVNEGLSERIGNNKSEEISISYELLEKAMHLGNTIEERINKIKELKKEGICLTL